MVTASTMAAVLRPYVDRMEFTAVVPPLGLIRYAQREGVLSKPAEDKDKHQAERQLNAKTKRIAEEWQKSEKKRLDER
eukprot:5819132-Prymnesium_polylepis.1